MFQLRNLLHVDRFSFWLGFLGGALFLYLLVRVRPVYEAAFGLFRQRIRTAQSAFRLGVEGRLRAAMLLQAQHAHLAASLFSLDEILIQPELLLPPVPPESEVAETVRDVAEEVLPYLLDWPEMAAWYGAPSASAAEALQGGANIAIVGEPGSGKTVALANLATQVLRKDPHTGSLASRLPIFVHAADLDLPFVGRASLVAPLAYALSAKMPAISWNSLEAILQSAFAGGRILLLLDGLDELPPAALTQAVDYLAKLAEKFSGLRCAVAASPRQFDRLPALGFVPLALAPWKSEQRAAFIKRWVELWEQHIAPLNTSQGEHVDPSILYGWLQAGVQHSTPLELTLKVWAAFAGDTRAPALVASLEAYVSRLLAAAGEAAPASAEETLEQLAGEMALSMQYVFARQAGALRAASGMGRPTSSGERGKGSFNGFHPLDESGAVAPPGADTVSEFQAVLDEAQIESLVKAGILAPRAPGWAGFCHPVVAAYLAGGGLARQGLAGSLLSQLDWTGKDLALQFYLARGGSPADLDPFLAAPDPLDMRLHTAARWLAHADSAGSWRAGVARRLVQTLQDGHASAPDRARAAAALAISVGSPLAGALRSWLSSTDAELRMLAALACGMLRDTAALPQLERLLEDPEPGCRRAACLALVATGDPSALESVASALVSGDEYLRCFAAHSLANDVNEGRPALVEALGLDDVRTRRAAILGLKRIRQPWVIETLQKVRAEDSQPVVRNAADDALESLTRIDPRVPVPLPPLAETPWLLAFASRQGIGVMPGKHAQDLVKLALAEGEPAQRLAAIRHLGYSGDDSACQALLGVYQNNRGEVRTAAWQALWLLAASGAPVPVGAGETLEARAGVPTLSLN